MSISVALKDKVSKRDLPGIRDALFMATMKDPGFSPSGAFAKALDFCLKNGISKSDLFQPDDGREIPSEISHEALARTCASLRTNFSERKLNAAQKIGRVLYPAQAEPITKLTFGPSRGTRTPKKVLAAIAIAALIALLLTMVKYCVRSDSEQNEGSKRGLQTQVHQGVRESSSTNHPSETSNALLNVNAQVSTNPPPSAQSRK